MKEPRVDTDGGGDAGASGGHVANNSCGPVLQLVDIGNAEYVSRFAAKADVTIGIPDPT